MFMLKKILIFFLLFFIGLPYQSTVIKVDEVNGIIMNWWFLWSFLLLIEVLWNSKKSSFKRLGGAFDNWATEIWGILRTFFVGHYLAYSLITSPLFVFFTRNIFLLMTTIAKEQKDQFQSRYVFFFKKMREEVARTVNRCNAGWGRWKSFVKNDQTKKKNRNFHQNCVLRNVYNQFVQYLCWRKKKINKRWTNRL